MKRLPEDISSKLLAASDQLKGTDLNVSIDDVAKMVDIPRATLYYYFSGKDDLLSFFLSDKLNRASVAVQKAVASEGTVVERLERILASVMEAMPSTPPSVPRCLQRSRNRADLKRSSTGQTG